ncbi:MAG: hypothetical protein WC346_03575 [Methanogenium sp.]|jgi:hypothetical protein
MATPFEADKENLCQTKTATLSQRDKFFLERKINLFKKIAAGSKNL